MTNSFQKDERHSYNPISRVGYRYASYDLDVFKIGNIKNPVEGNKRESHDREIVGVNRASD